MKLMESYKENGTINLRQNPKKVEATRIIKKSPLQDKSRVISVSSPSSVRLNNFAALNSIPSKVGRHDLTDNNFSVTRARAHARAYARENTRVEINKNNLGLKRVLDAALSGGDVKVASIEPMSFGTRLIAVLLIPIMLIMPILPAYANEAPLAERVATDVSEILNTGATVVATDTSSPTTPEVAPTENVEGSSVAQPDTTSPEAQTDVAQTAADNTTTNPGEVAGVADTATPTEEPAKENGGGGGADAETASTTNDNNVVINNNPEPLFPNNIASTTEAIAEVINENITEDAPTETQVLDVASDDVKEDLQALRIRLREEVKTQVRNEVRKEVEREVYNGCKNLDGAGYYCIPDAKSFGSATVKNDRSITVSVQVDPVEGDKEIFLERDGIAVQLTHNIDDDVFPVLDPNSDLLVWQSLLKGKWQIAYAHVNDVGVPKVKYLTAGENNFNPKVYRGRIVWQTWVAGNWEIFTVIKAREFITDDSLSEDHRLAQVDGNWDIKRITANNVPDMFPTVTSDTITWQSIDDGVWQVFAYDLINGTTHRVSKKGVKSESPRTALVWSEEDETGQVRLVGSDVNNSESIDFTSLARRIVDQSKDKPKSPITNTEIVVEKPATTKGEDEIVVVN